MVFLSVSLSYAMPTNHGRRQENASWSLLRRANATGAAACKDDEHDGDSRTSTKASINKASRSRVMLEVHVVKS